MSSPVLVLRVTAELPPDEWQIADRTAEIGRLPTSTVVLPHRSVSREHAHISRVGDDFLVEDLGSKNGTWLNEQQVKGPMTLKNGDMLLIGDVPLQVVLSSLEESAPVAPPQPPVPALPRGGPSGPSTVMVGLEDVLQGAPPSEARRPRAWDETPSSPHDIPAVLPPPPLPQPPPSPSGRGLYQGGEGASDDDHPTIYAPLPTDLGPEAALTPALSQREREGDARPLDLDPISLQAEPAAATLARLSVAADSVSAALRALSSDLATAVWLFEHAGGAEAAQTFIDCVNSAYLNPEDPLAQQAVLDEAPTAARLLQAASLLMRGLLPLHVDAADGRGDEPQTDTTDLEPVARP